MTRNTLIGLLAAIFLASPAASQTDTAPPVALVIPEVPGDEIPLETAGPAAPDTEQWNRVIGQVWVRNVTRPSLYRIAPKNGRDNGRAVIIVPGGGYSFVSIESEGFWVGERLAAQGYTAFVLKYRPRATPGDPGAFMTRLLAEWSGQSNDEDFDYPPAVDDLAAAVSLVHGKSEEWGLAQDRLGVIGFSAGAHSAIRLLEGREEASLVQNLALIYPPVEQDIAMKPRPDLFMSIATDDFLFHEGILDLAGDWHESGGSVEFHLYSGGSHGFGMRPQGTTSDLWIDQYIAWLDLRGATAGAAVQAD